MTPAVTVQLVASGCGVLPLKAWVFALVTCCPFRGCCSSVFSETGLGLMWLHRGTSVVFWGCRYLN